MAEPIRILQLIKGLGRGGAEVLLPEGLRCADRRRFHYEYAYFLPWKDQLRRALVEQGAEVRCLGARSSVGILARVPRLARLVRRSRIDLLHCHLSMAAVAGRLAARIAGIPVVYTQHGPLEFSNTLSRRANLLTWGLQDQVIAVSQEVTESIARHAGDRVPVQRIENAVATEHFRPDPVRRRQLRSNLEIPPSALVVGTVAVFRPQKRLEDWLRVGRRLRAERPNTRLLIVGDGPLKDRLLEAARELDLSDAVHFVGLQDDVRPYLDAMDVYLMSSGFEGLPVALLEAMAMELPVVSTAVGGIVDVVDETCGVLTEVGELGALSEAVLSMLQDEDRRQTFGTAARRRIQERFSMQRMIRETEEIYLQVLEGRGE